MPENTLAPREGRPASAPPQTFEEWATAKLRVDFIGESKRATAVRRGRRITKLSNAALVNAARTLGRIPVNKRMTEAEFDAAMQAASNITCSIS